MVAVIVTMSPVDPPVADIVGVASEVRLSVAEVPRSDVAARSGVDGADDAVVSMVRESAAPEAETLPA